MTARVLNMGLMKAVADFKHLSQVGDAVSTPDICSFYVI
jgi:hypothetical protein